MKETWKALGMEDYTVREEVRMNRRQGDEKAQYILRRLLVSVYDEIDDPPRELLKCRAVTALMHAETYLEDRLLYQLYPPPNKLAVLVESEVV